MNEPNHEQRIQNALRSDPPAWYREALILSRLQCWEAMLLVYLPVWKQVDNNGNWQKNTWLDRHWISLFPQAYWQWLNEGGSEVHRRLFHELNAPTSVLHEP